MRVDKEQLKKCPKCGTLFSCFGENDCWCEDIKLHKKEMVEIMNNYEDCLCPECLKEFEKD